MPIDTKQIHKTVLGVALWPHLTTPRAFKGKGEKSYDVGLGLGPNYVDRLAKKGEKPAAAAQRLAHEVDEFTSFLDGLLEQHVEDSKLPPRTPPYGPVYEKVDEVKTEVEGATHFKFKVPAETKTKKGDIWYRKPRLFDAAGHPITGDVEIGGGSLIRIQYKVWPTTGQELAGLRLEPIKVQIVKLVEGYEGDSFESFDSDEYDVDTFSADDVPTGDF